MAGFITLAAVAADMPDTLIIDIMSLDAVSIHFAAPAPPFDAIFFRCAFAFSTISYYFTPLHIISSRHFQRFLRHQY